MRAGGGVELFVGVLRDPLWGPAIAVGLGGIWVEALRDTAIRLLPVTPDEVLEMFSELRGAKLLDGYRGTPGIDRRAAARRSRASATLRWRSARHSPRSR